MPTDIKQFKTINSGEFLGNMISKLGKEALTKFAVPLTKDSLPELATKTTSSAIDKFERKISGRGAVRAGKGFTLFITNEDMDDINRIIKSIENSGLLMVLLK